MVELSDIFGAISAGVSIFNPAVGAGLGIVGGLISGSESSVQGITAAQQASISGGFGGPTLSTGTSVGPPVGQSPAVMQAGFEGLGGALLRAVPRIVGAVGGGAVGAVGSSMLLGPPPPPRGSGMPTRRQLILAQARAFSPGATAKKIVRSARQCGIELSAATFGLDVLSVCFLIAQPASRRARGISAADLRRTRSTLRKVANIQHDLGHLKSPIRRRRSK